MASQERVLLIGDGPWNEPLRAALCARFQVERCPDAETAGTILGDGALRAAIVMGLTGADPSAAAALLPGRRAIPLILLTDSQSHHAESLPRTLDAVETIALADQSPDRVALAVETAIRSQSLMRENALLTQVIEHASDCIITVGPTGGITLANRAVAHAFGYSAGEVLGLNVDRLFPRSRPRGLAEEMLDALKSGNAWSGEVTACRRDGAAFPIHVALTFVRDREGNATTAILHARDVTDQQRLLDRLKQLSITDDLTGAYNARYLWARLRYEFLRARRYSQPICCLMVDLDRFKLVNDTHGHRAGDEVLRLVTKTMDGVIREVDIAARYGGEEFAVILPNTQMPGAMQCAEHIRRSIEACTMTVAAATLQVTVSLGVAELTPDTDDEEEFLRRADNALIQAKREGRNRVCLWRPELGGSFKQRPAE